MLTILPYLQTIETIDDPTIATEVKVEMVNTITNTLIEATSTGNVTEATPLYPQELSSTVDIVNSILDFLIAETTVNSDVQTELNTVSSLATTSIPVIISVIFLRGECA